MPARTQRVLEALGEEESFKLLEILRVRAVPQTMLARDAGVSAGSAKHRLDVLRALEIIDRPSPQGPYKLQHREAVFAVLEAAARLADEINGVDPHASTSATRTVKKDRMRSDPPAADSVASAS